MVAEICCKIAEDTNLSQLLGCHHLGQDWQRNMGYCEQKFVGSPRRFYHEDRVVVRIKRDLDKACAYSTRSCRPSVYNVSHSMADVVFRSFGNVCLWERIVESISRQSIIKALRCLCNTRHAKYARDEVHKLHCTTQLVRNLLSKGYKLPFARKAIFLLIPLAGLWEGANDRLQNGQEL